MAFIVGYQDTNTGDVHATHMVFPVQEGNSSRVDDKGVDGQDSAMYMAQHLKPSIEDEVTKKFVIISWVHTHVRGVCVGFSSVDVHNQYMYAQMYNPDAFGLVFEVHSRYKYCFDAYVLTDEGRIGVAECNQLRGQGNVQHNECYDKSLYKSIKSKLVFTDSPLTVVDARGTQSVDLGPSSSNFGNIKTEVFLHKQCKSCKRPHADDSQLLRHISHKKQCKEDYGPSFDEFSSHIRKESKKSYDQKNAESIKQKKQSSYNDKKETILKKQSDYDLKNRFKILSKQAKYN